MAVGPRSPALLVVGPHGQAHKVLVLEAGLALHLPVPGPEGVSQPLHLQGKTNTEQIEHTEITKLFLKKKSMTDLTTCLALLVLLYRTDKNHLAQQLAGIT